MVQQSIIRILFLLAFSLPATAATRFAPALPPPAGDYQCFAWTVTGSTKTPKGTQQTYGQTTSPLGTITLDGTGTYNNSAYKTSGNYNYSSKRGRVVFTTGKLAKLQARAEMGEQEYRLRFSLRDKPLLRGEAGAPDQVCVLRDARFHPSKEKVPELFSSGENLFNRFGSGSMTHRVGSLLGVG
jgi:hypothetical protein